MFFFVLFVCFSPRKDHKKSLIVFGIAGVVFGVFQSMLGGLLVLFKVPLGLI